MQRTFFFGLILTIILIAACARRDRPTGGPKDKTPPVMLSANPAQFSVNFKASEVKILFDEYIKLKDLNTQLIVSPPLKYQPIIGPLGVASKSISIKILDTLKDNTTYTFNFGQSVLDNAEGNILNNFKYVFSTGPIIDSLKISGGITDAFNREADENISVMLYEINKEFSDSIIYKEKPLYVANSLDTTVWEISNIKEGVYFLVALRDATRNYIYDPKQDKIAFFKHAINIPTDSTFVMELFKEVLPYKLARPSELNKGHFYIAFEGNADSLKVQALNETESFKSFSNFVKDKDSLNLWFKGATRDSIQLQITNKLQRDTLVVKLRKNLLDSLSISSSARGILNLRDQFKLKSNIPIAQIDSSKFMLSDMDSIKVPFTLDLNKSRDELEFIFNKKHNQRYLFEIAPGAIQDFFGQGNDSLKYTLSTKEPEDYGNLYLSLKNVQTYPVIVQLLNKNGDLVEEIYAEQEQEFPFLNLVPANYMIRIIFDENGNKKWDTGNYLQKLQPERVVYYFEEIAVRANWEMPISFILN